MKSLHCLRRYFGWGSLALTFLSVTATGAAQGVIFVPGPNSGYVAPGNAPPRVTINEAGVGTDTRQLLPASTKQAATWTQANSPGVLLPTGSFTDTYSTMIGGTGQIIGYGVSAGITTAVRWESSGSLTVLGSLTAHPVTGAMDARALAINQSGLAVGYSQLYGEDGSSLGTRAVTWSPGSTTPTVLALASDNGDFGVAQAKIVSNNGQILGDGQVYVDGTAVGQRGIRWDSTGTIATTLETISTKSDGFGFSEVKGVNAGGVAIGNYTKYDAGGISLGLRPVRWDPLSDEPIPLGILGEVTTSAVDHTALAIDNAGNIAGLSQKYVGGVAKGSRPVVWLAGETTPRELDILGEDATGATRGNMSDMNNAGFIAGTIQTFTNGGGRKAVIWGLDGHLVNLNDLLPTNSGWVLTVATDITDSGWIAGYGTYDADGPGGAAPVDRYFSLQSDMFAVPEPGTALLMLGALSVFTLRRSRASAS